MTATLQSDSRAIRRAAIRATLAPSVYNTQPWRFVLSATTLEICADWTRQLRALDPRGRQLLISCGCALFNAKVALAAYGYAASVSVFADLSRPDLVARLRLPDTKVSGLSIAALEPWIDHRRTNRGTFTDERVPPEVVARLTIAAQQEGAELFPIVRIAHRLATARLSRLADDTANRNPAYRAELRAWTHDDPQRSDGVPAADLTHVDPSAHGDPLVQDLDARHPASLPIETNSGIGQCLLLLGTTGNQAVDWVRAGEALERVLLELARSGYVASPVTQVIEVAATNAALREQLQLTAYPHVLLRVGRAPATPASRRRRLVDMLEEAR